MKYVVIILILGLMVTALSPYVVSREILISELSDNQTRLVNELDTLNEEYAELSGKYNELVNKQFDIGLNNPTYEQVKILIGELKSVSIGGNCLDKVKYTQDCFFDKGLQCYVAISNYKGGFGHSTVAFNTDKGWVYVEPDGMMEIEIAKDMPYYIPYRAYDTPVGMTAQKFIEDNTVIQLVVFR